MELKLYPRYKMYIFKFPYYVFDSVQPNVFHEPVIFEGILCHVTIM